MCDKLTSAQTEYLESVDTVSDSPIAPGTCASCAECRSTWGYDDEAQMAADIESGIVCDEGGFSRYPCDCCGSHLGGNRYDAHTVEPEGDIVHWSICEDCLCFLANGDIPELPYE